MVEKYINEVFNQQLAKLDITAKINAAVEKTIKDTVTKIVQEALSQTIDVQEVLTRIAKNASVTPVDNSEEIHITADDVVTEAPEVTEVTEAPEVIEAFEVAEAPEAPGSEQASQIIDGINYDLKKVRETFALGVEKHSGYFSRTNFLQYEKAIEAIDAISDDAISETAQEPTIEQLNAISLVLVGIIDYVRKDSDKILPHEVTLTQLEQVLTWLADHGATELSAQRWDGVLGRETKHLMTSVIQQEHI